MTELRTKTTDLLRMLRRGQPVNLIHRSQIVAQINPQPKVFKATNFEKLTKAIDALGIKTRTTPAQREKIYRQHLEAKYGKSVS